MKAMRLHQIWPRGMPAAPLVPEQMATPRPKSKEVLIQVSACGVCHTELDEIEGRTPPARLPMVLGHQAVGQVVACGPNATQLKTGTRVGVAWIHSTCGTCPACLRGDENLCSRFRATGRDVDGGYAEYMTVPEESAYPIPDVFSDVQAAPLLCAGAIGYRSLRLTGITDGHALGLAGFGASAHLVMQLVKAEFPQSRIHVFARSRSQRDFARQLGAVWTGDFDTLPPERLDAIIDTTPAWKPIVTALQALRPGGRLVINAIRKEPRDQKVLTRLDYADHLWLEKEIKSVANVTRKDVADFLNLSVRLNLNAQIRTYPLTEANQALRALREGGHQGAHVLEIT